MPLPDIILPLTDPIDGHHGKIKSITLSEPKYPVIMALGRPVTTIRTQEGAVYQTQDPEIIKRYAEKMVDQEKVAPVLHLLGMADTLALQDAVLDFFTAARAVPAPKRS